MKYQGAWLLAVLLLAIPAGQVLAVPGEHDHLDEVPGLTFAILLEAALRQAPQALEAPVRSQQAQAYSAAGSRLLAGRPSLVYDLVDDRWGANLGLREQDAGIQLPLWRPGERRAAQAIGGQYQEQTRLWSDYLRWQLAGQLRSALNALEVAEVNLALEREAGSTATQVQRVTEQMVEAGALARLDLLQAQALQLEQQQRILAAEAAMVDAERSFQVLTGLLQRPAEPLHEQLNPQQDIEVASHPLLRYLQSEVVVAQGNVQQSELTAKGNPQLTIGAHSERADRFQTSNGSVMLSLSIPIGGKTLISAHTSTARRQQVDAEVNLRRSQIELQRLLHEAEHTLFITQQALPLAQQQTLLAEQRLNMATSAFEVGELTLTQVLAAAQGAASARQALSQLQLEQQRLTSDYNQLIGVLP